MDCLSTLFLLSDLQVKQQLFESKVFQFDNRLTICKSLFIMRRCLLADAPKKSGSNICCAPAKAENPQHIP